MSTKLIPGDRVYFVQKGRKLRGVVSDTLSLKTRREELLVPVVRPRASKKVSCNADMVGRKTAHDLKTRWLPRSEVRKLPAVGEIHNARAAATGSV